jgi:hypothetical protein
LLDKGIETPIPGISAFAGARKTVDNKNIKDNGPKTKEERNLFNKVMDLRRQLDKIEKNQKNNRNTSRIREIG